MSDARDPSGYSAGDLISMASSLQQSWRHSSRTRKKSRTCRSMTLTRFYVPGVKGRCTRMKNPSTFRENSRNFTNPARDGASVGGMSSPLVSSLGFFSCDRLDIFPILV
jgi:hypothetical protein